MGVGIERVEDKGIERLYESCKRVGRSKGGFRAKRLAERIGVFFSFSWAEGGGGLPCV